MKTWILALNKLFLSFAVVTTLVACDETGFSPKQKDRNSRNHQDLSPSGIPLNGNPEGTTDTGGGNGLNDRVFESYAVSLSELPAYQNFVLPVLTYFFDPSNNDYNSIYGSLLEKYGLSNKESPANVVPQFMSLKSIFLGPFDLKTLGNDVIGVSFFKNTSQQLAVQTRKAIWIDSRIFSKKMSETEQGEVLLHEIIEHLYLQRFLSDYDYCLSQSIQRVSKTAIQYFDCEKAKGHPKLQPQESWRPLNSGDYESIRNITTWFITNYRTKRKISVSEWSIFASNGFDTRDIDDLNETDESDDSDENSNVELTREEVSDIINANNQIGSLPSKCLLREGYKVIKCSTRLRIESPFQLSDKSVDRFARLSLEISGENGFVKNADLLINERTDLDRLQIEGFDQFFTVTAHPILANVKKGDDTEIYTLTFKLSRFPLTYELVGIASSRAKVVKIDDFEYSDSTCSVGLQSDDYEADFYAFSEKYTERLLEEVDVESGSSIECSRK